MSRIHSGATEPNYSELKQLAEFFNVPVSYFFETTEEPLMVKDRPPSPLLEEAMAEAEEIRLKAMALQGKLRRLKE